MSTKTNLITLVTKVPEFKVEFNPPLPANEIALTQLRCYYSWPNVRAEPFRGKLPNNSFTFSSNYKLDTDKNTGVSTISPTTTWHTIHIPTGAYDIEDLNEIIREEIENITGPNIISGGTTTSTADDKYPIEIHAKESSLSSIIEVNSPTYAVDIYNSSLRTLLGYPENHPGVISWKDLPPEPDRSDPVAHADWLKKLPAAHPRLPEPKLSDFTTDTLQHVDYNDGGFFNALSSADTVKHYRVLTNDQSFEYIRDGPITWRFESPSIGYFTVPYNNLSLRSSNMKQLFQKTLQQQRDLFRGILQTTTDCINVEITRSKILDNTKILNQIIADMNSLNSALSDMIISDNDESVSKKDFLRVFSLDSTSIPNYKFTPLKIPDMKTSIKNTANEFFPQIHALWYKLIPANEILSYDNSPRRKHIHVSPRNVNISTTIAIHVVCDAIMGSYAVDTSVSDDAKPGSVLFTFSPNVSPGSLIVMNPPNLIYLETANNRIAKMYFRITDQDFSLLDLRGETLQITLDVKS